MQLDLTIHPMVSWVYFHALVNKAWELQTSPLKLFWKKWNGKIYFGFITFQSYQIDSKVQWVDGRSCHDWTRSCSCWSQEQISLKFQYMEVVLVAMSPHHHPQQLLFTNKEYWDKKFVQTCQSSSKHSLDLEARVLNFKGAYLAHLLVFLSDSKDILLLKGLSTNHFKNSKYFSCGRNLVKKKDYKSSRWIHNFT